MPRGPGWRAAAARNERAREARRTPTRRAADAARKAKAREDARGTPEGIAARAAHAARMARARKEKRAAALAAAADEIVLAAGEGADVDATVAEAEDAVDSAELLLWKSTGLCRDRDGEDAPPQIAEAPLREFNEETYDAYIGGCAACGCLFSQPTEPLDRNVYSAEVVRVFAAQTPEGQEPRQPHGLSARGVGKDCAVGLLKGNVGGRAGKENGHFVLCGQCDAAFAAGKRLGSWGLDLGDPYGFGPAKGLPDLSPVEKAAIATYRLYGVVVKIRDCGIGGPSAPVRLEGHMIAFPQDSRHAIANRGAGREEIPREDVSDSVRVHFVGPKAGWEHRMPLLISAGGPLEVCEARLLLWLNFLKATHPQYAGINVELAPERIRRLQASVKRLVAAAPCTEDPADIATEAAVTSDVGAGDPQRFGLDASMLVGNRPETSVGKEIAARTKAIHIGDSGIPANEFEQNEAIITGAFPWVFSMGTIAGLNRGNFTKDLRRQLVLQSDGRVQREQILLLHLFNQMQRHRTAQGIANADPRLVDELAALSRRPNFKSLLAESSALGAGQSEDAAKATSLLLSAIHIGMASVPFSRSEMDSGYFRLVSMLRLRGSFSVFFTVTPQASENKFALRLVSGGGEDLHTAEYDVRCAAVFQNPGFAAFFFEKILDSLERLVIKTPRATSKKTTDPLQAEPGIFGRVIASARTIEEQARTLLHAHCMFWTEFSPELCQQTIRQGGPHTKAFVDMIDSVCRTSMRPEFWTWATELWESKTLAPAPGLQSIPPRDSEAMVARIDASVYKFNLHKTHRPTCFPFKKKMQGNRPQYCRFRAPWPPFEMDTCPAQLILGEKGKDGKQEVVEKIDFDRTDIPCTHVKGCTCTSVSDLLDFGRNGPVVILTKRMRGTRGDQIVAGFCPEVSALVCSNNSTSVLSSSSMAMVLALYIIKYNTKGKATVANAITSALAARVRIDEAQADEGERTFWNKFVNAFTAHNQVSASIAAYALLGNRGFQCTDEFWYLFPWDVVPLEFRLGRGPSATAPRCEDDEEDDGEEQAPRDGDALFDDFERDAATNTRGMVFTIDERIVCVEQGELYAARPPELEEVCLVTFCCIFEVEKVPTQEDGRPELPPAPLDGRREKNPRYYFAPGFRLAEHYRLRLRSKLKLPALAGPPPPLLPYPERDGRRFERARAAWAAYNSVLFIPWRDASDAAKPYEYMEQWLLESLSGARGEANRHKAVFCTNYSAAMRKNEKFAQIINAYTSKCAEAKVPGKTVFEAGAADQAPRGVEVDINFAEQVAKMICSEDRGDMVVGQRRAEQLTGFVSDLGQPCPLAPRASSACSEEAARNAEELCDRACNAIREFEPAPPRREQNPSATGRGQQSNLPASVPPLPEGHGLNDEQRQLREMVFDAAISAKQELVFVQGGAGTGKSFFIRHIAKEFEQVYGPNSVRCLAPTGVGAANLVEGTLTINSGLGIDPLGNNVLEDLSRDKHTKIIQRYAETFVFIIDEISMVSPALLSKVSERLKTIAAAASPRSARPRPDADAPFGGFIVLFFGDFRQCQPVKSRTLLEEALYPSHGLAMTGGALWRSVRLFRFTQQMRADSDPVQRERAASLDGGEVQKTLIDGLPRLASLADGWDQAVFLTGTNAERHAINDVMARVFALRHGVPIVKWKNGLSGKRAASLSAAVEERLRKMTPELSSTFVAGAPCMILANFNPACWLANGSVGKFCSICGVADADRDSINRAAPGDVVWLSAPPKYVNVWLPGLDGARADIPCVEIGRRKSFPLPAMHDTVSIKGTELSFQWHYCVLAFAMTIHKIQGQTLDRVVLCLDKTQARMTYEQVLVAVTRVRRADDLRVLPALPGNDATFAHLHGLKQHDAVVEWFRGSFNKDGLRRYVPLLRETVAQRKTATRVAKRGREPNPAPKAKPKASARRGREPISVDDGSDNEPEAVGSEIVAIEIRTWGKYIRSEVIDALMLDQLSGDLFVSGLFLRETVGQPNVARAGIAARRVFATWLHYAGHFIAARVDLDARTLSVRNSKIDYRPGEELAEIARAKLLVEEATGSPPLTVVRQEHECRQQVESECAVMTIENLPHMMLGGALVEMTRDLVATRYLEIYRSFD